MAFKGTSYRLLTLLLLLVVSVAAAIWAAVAGYYPLLALAAALSGAALYLIFRLWGRNVRKLTFLFDSIANGDYSFKFSEYDGPVSDNLLNHALNRIRDLLAAEKQNITRMEEYYKLILDSVNTGVLVVDEYGNIYQSNREARRLLRLPVLTHTGQLSRTGETLPEAFASIRPNRTAQAAFDTETGAVNLLLNASAVTAKGRSMRIIAFSEIGSQLDEREAESWIKLTRVLTHEIMNSITPITSLTDTLLELKMPAGQNGGELKKGLSTIKATSNALRSFVNSYRRFTHIPAPELELFYLRPLFERLVMLNRRPGVEIALRISPDDLILHADENLIAQVLTNLLSNALHAVSDTEAARIRISAFVNGDDHVVVEITDNGAGIPEEIRPQIFVPFFTTRADGSGIGLSISRQIMRLHGGTLSLSAAPGETRFILTFQ